MKSIIEYINESKEIKHYVDGILVNKDTDEILLLQRAGYVKPFGGKWGFVGGSIDKSDKSAKDALIREIKEETGIELSFNEKHSMKHLTKKEHFDSSNKEIISDTEYYIINMESKPEVKISREHARYKWFDETSIKEKQNKCVPDVFQIIQKYYDE